MTTVHAYTADQRWSTSRTRTPPHARRGAQHHPHLDGRREGSRARDPRARGQAPRVRRTRPVATGSLVDLVVEVGRATSVEEVNAAFDARSVSASSRASCVLGRAVRLLGRHRTPFSGVFDSGLTSVVGGTLVKVVAWYDNEWGYSCRLVDVAQRVLVPITA